MEQASEEAPLTADSRAGSEQVLVEPSGRATGSSNSYALKVAGITTLVCLLVSAQAFTAYMVFNQKQQIQGLQDANHRLTQMGQRSQEPPKKMVMPIGSLPFMDFFDDDGKSPKPTTPKPKPKVQLPKASPSVEEQLQELMKDFKLPHFNKTFLANLVAMKQQSNETSWKSFESWLRYWLLFQEAQKTPTPHPAVKTKCQTEAINGVRSGLVGSFKPKCDEQGKYRQKQCWPSTGMCWCVDDTGALIKGTHTRGDPNCDKVLGSRLASSDPVMMPILLDDAEK